MRNLMCISLYKAFTKIHGSNIRYISLSLPIYTLASFNDEILHYVPTTTLCLNVLQIKKRVNKRDMSIKTQVLFKVVICSTL